MRIYSVASWRFRQVVVPGVGRSTGASENCLCDLIFTSTDLNIAITTFKYLPLLESNSCTAWGRELVGSSTSKLKNQKSEWMNTSLRLTVTFVLRFMRRTRIPRTFCWGVYISIKQVIKMNNLTSTGSSKNWRGFFRCRQDALGKRLSLAPVAHWGFRRSVLQVVALHLHQLTWTL